MAVSSNGAGRSCTITLSTFGAAENAAPYNRPLAVKVRIRRWRLRRVRPVLIEQLEGTQILVQADAMLAARGSLLASQALTIPNPQMWLMAAHALVQAFEDVELAEARSTLAEGLLTDLDDATLVTAQ